MIPCFHTLAAGGGDGLFFFILVVITVVVQIFRLSRRSRPPSGGEAPGDSAFGRGDELGDFLETLARSGAPPAERTARTPAPPPVPVRPAPARASPSPPTKPSSRAMRVRQGSSAVSQPAVSSTPRRVRTSPVHQNGTRQPGASCLEIVKRLRRTRSIRQAVLLREILGPPTGLAGPPGHSRP